MPPKKRFLPHGDNSTEVEHVHDTAFSLISLLNVGLQHVQISLKNK